MQIPKEMLDSLPDYDVFTDSTIPPEPGGKKPKKAKSKKSLSASPRAGRANTDYGDGYGVYVDSSGRRHNFMTVFLFPVALLWLEIALRLGCKEGFEISSLIYIFFLTIPFASVLTFLCTLGSKGFNRVLSDIILLLLTLWYCFQLIYYDASGAFLTISSLARVGEILSSLDVIIGAVLNVKYYVIAAFVPFLFNLLLGRYVFPFNRIRIPAKIVLLLAAVLFQLLAVTTVSFSKDSPSANSSYSLYYGELRQNSVQEKFGLFTMQRLDASQHFFSRNSRTKSAKAQTAATDAPDSNTVE